jgi:hypothetical protein
VAVLRRCADSTLMCNVLSLSEKTRQCALGIWKSKAMKYAQDIGRGAFEERQENGE